MHSRRTVGLAVLTLCLGTVIIAQDQLPVANWIAPPYWTPPAAGQTEREPGEMEASALALPSPPLPFVAIAPCRIVDTRVALSDGFHQPAFADNETRTFNFPASTGCPGLPATAGAYSVNFNYRPLNQASYLTAFPTGTTMPVVATVVGYSTTTFTGNAAIVPAGTSGQIDVYSQFAAHVVIDINGYYGPQSVVTSLNTLTGDLTLAQGANITITPGTGTLTIAASAPTGPAGPIGLTGPTGPTGATGATGAAGSGGGLARPGFSISPLATVGTATIGYTSIAIGADGLGLIAYYDGTNQVLNAAHCNDLGCTSASTAVVDPASHVGQFPSLAIGADGLGLISYLDATNGVLKVAHCTNAACSTATLATVDSGPNVGEYTSITVGTDGLGLIAYFDYGAGHLKVAHCNDAPCTTAAVATVDSAADLGYYTSITIGADGLGLISYWDHNNLYLKAAHCADIVCSAASAGSPVTLDATAQVGLHTSITIGGDGLGLISYYDYQNHTLKVAHCNDAPCLTAGLATIDSTASAYPGQYTSITTGSNGFGLISHYDGFNGLVKVAACLNQACSSAASVVLDSAPFVGGYTSITIGTDGFGLVAFFDSTHHQLNAVHCSNALCTPYVRRR